MWKYFQRDSKNANIAICNVKSCGAEVVLSGNTTNCRDHIARFHSSKLLDDNSDSVVVTSSDSSNENEFEANPHPDPAEDDK